jgi:hypothetical protein
VNGAGDRADVDPLQSFELTNSSPRRGCQRSIRQATQITKPKGSIVADTPFDNGSSRFRAGAARRRSRPSKVKAVAVFQLA